MHTHHSSKEHPFRLFLFAAASLVAIGSIAIGMKGFTAQNPFFPPFSAPASSRVVEGSITFLSGADASAPNKVVVLTRGREAVEVYEVMIDPNETVIMQGGRVTRVSQLENGQKVKVRYSEKDGFNVAGVIEITDPLPIPARAVQETPAPDPAKPKPD